MRVNYQVNSTTRFRVLSDDQIEQFDASITNCMFEEGRNEPAVVREVWEILR